jgi:hypothetical protein
MHPRDQFLCETATRDGAEPCHWKKEGFLVLRKIERAFGDSQPSVSTINLHMKQSIQWHDNYIRYEWTSGDPVSNVCFSALVEPRLDDGKAMHRNQPHRGFTMELELVHFLKDL